VFDDDFFDDKNSTSQKNTSIHGFDPSVDLPLSLYCEVINSLDASCWETNLAELWNFDQSTVSSLTKEDILRKINGRTVRCVFLIFINSIST